MDKMNWLERWQLSRWVDKVIKQTIYDHPMPDWNDIEWVGDWMTNTLFDLKNRLEGFGE